MPFARRRGVADRRVIALLTLADNLEEAARSRLLVICPIRYTPWARAKRPVCLPPTVKRSEL